jgi:hypothetical protein
MANGQTNVPAAVIDLDNDEELLRYTLNERLKIAAHISQQENSLSNEDLLSLHMTNLAGIEKVSLSRLKIKSDENIHKGNEDLAAAVVSTVLNQMKQNSNPWLILDNAPERIAPSLPDELEGEFVFDEREMSAGGGHRMDVESFTKMYKEKHSDE